MAQRALHLEPRFVEAAALAAHLHRDNVVHGFTVDAQFDRNEATRLARVALSIDEHDELALAAAGLNAGYFEGDYETGIELIDRAVVANPNEPRTWRTKGWIHKMSGNHEEAIRSFERGIRLSPLDPGRHNNLAGIGVALIELGRFEEAVTISKQSLRQNSSDGVAPRGLAAALAHLRRDAEAAKGMDPQNVGKP